MIGQRHQRQRPAFALLSARRMKMTYLMVTMRNSAQIRSEDHPCDIRGEACASALGMDEGFAEGVEWRGADIAIDNADRSEGQGGNPAFRCDPSARDRHCLAWGKRAQALCRSPYKVSPV